MMHITFYWGKQVTLLFHFWNTQTWLEYSLTLLACLLSSSMYQYLDSLRLNLSPNLNLNLSLRFGFARYTSMLPSGSLYRAAGSVLFSVNSALGYMIMLSVMSFNGGVFVAVVLGLAVGHFFFRSSSSSDTPADGNACACA